MSGEALNSTQSRSLALMAMEDWVRDCALIEPSRTPWQLGQLQFHCGNPPPAPEPRIRIRIGLFHGYGVQPLARAVWLSTGCRTQNPWSMWRIIEGSGSRAAALAVVDVQIDLKTETQIFECWSRPFHAVVPL